MKVIELTQGQVALVDDEDFERALQYKWYALWNPTSKTFYARTNIKLLSGKRGHLKMHRFILDLGPNDPEVDHLNWNGTDNRRSNLRVVTHQANTRNRRKPSSSGFNIERANSKRNPFSVRIRHNGRKVYLGVFSTAESAQAARQEFMSKHGIA